MSGRRKLTEAEIEERLSRIPGWTVVGGKLHRELTFGDFVGAWSFMCSMALVSQAADHHPEWLNVYNRVVVDLTTHDAGGITARDFEWAEEADRRLTP